MKHTNPNMIEPVLAGIELGAKLVGDPDGERIFADVVDDAARLHAALQPGPSGFRVGSFVPARQLAFSEGFIAAYRTGTEQL